jgi:hypothetical protein
MRPDVAWSCLCVPILIAGKGGRYQSVGVGVGKVPDVVEMLSITLMDPSELNFPGRSDKTVTRHADSSC